MRVCTFLAVLGLLSAGVSSPAWADEKSHRAAAEDLLKTANAEQSMEAAIDQMLAAQIKANPQLEPIKDVMRKFLAKHVGYAALKDDLVKIYMAEFTEQELREIAAFYRTPTGKKAVEKLPLLMQKGGELGMKRVQENLPELNRLIQEAQKKKP